VRDELAFSSSTQRSEASENYKLLSNSSSNLALLNKARRDFISASIHPVEPYRYYRSSGNIL